MAIIVLPTTFVDGTIPTASQFNGDFNTIYTEFNGNITNANISTSAAIAESKIAFNTSTGHTHNGVDSKLIPSDGWNTFSGTLAYSSVDGHVFVVTTTVDPTTLIQKGDRIKFTNNAVTFYGIVVAIASGTITIYGGTDNVVANSAITSPYYSHNKNPFGFNIDPLKWTEQTTDITNATQASPVNGTWYNLGSLKLDVPIGAWHLCYKVVVSTRKSTTYTASVKSTLSTANNTESDGDFTTYYSWTQSYAQYDKTIFNNAYVDKHVLLASKTSYYLNAAAQEASQDDVSFRGDLAKTIIKAVSAYL